jgi:inhibitor of KinA sporulation pathway (predicted exonuclease)
MRFPSGLIVFDLEYTTWEGALARNWNRPGEHREVVQIGAVRLDGTLTETASLSLLVRPRVNPILSDYFINLTGISQSQIEEHGIPFPTALARFVDFAGDLPFASNGPDDMVLMENCRLCAVDFPFAGRCHNLSGLFAEKLGGGHHVVSSTLPAKLETEATGAAHDGLADARAVALTLRRLVALAAAS